MQVIGRQDGSGTSMCPIGYNAAFCAGWDSNNDDYGGQDCADQPLANISQGLIGYNDQFSDRGNTRISWKMEFHKSDYECMKIYLV